MAPAIARSQRLYGSEASRNPSPTRLNARTATITTSPGISSQGASAKVWIFCASCNSTPQLIAGGRIPSPRKESEVSLMINTGMASELVAMIWLRNAHMAQNDPRLTAAGEFGREHEVFLAQCQKPAAHLAPERGPADQRENHGDREEHLTRRPVARQGGREGEPDRDRRYRLQQLDQPLNHLVCEPAEVAGDAAQNHAENDAERDGDETDRHRGLGAVHDA